MSTTTSLPRPPIPSGRRGRSPSSSPPTGPTPPSPPPTAPSACCAPAPVSCWPSSSRRRPTPRPTRAASRDRLMTEEEAEHDWEDANDSGEEALGRTTSEMSGEVEERVVASDESAGNAIVHCAEEIGADLVVVGASGKGLFKRLFSGSVSDHVVHHTAVPRAGDPARTRGRVSQAPGTPETPLVAGREPAIRHLGDPEVPVAAGEAPAQRRRVHLGRVGAVAGLQRRPALPVAARPLRPGHGGAPPRALQPARRLRHRRRAVGRRRAVPRRQPRRAADSARRSGPSARHRGRGAVRGDAGRPAVVGRRPTRSPRPSPSRAPSRSRILLSTTRPGSATCAIIGSPTVAEAARAASSPEVPDATDALLALPTDQ